MVVMVLLVVVVMGDGVVCYNSGGGDGVAL